MRNTTRFMLAALVLLAIGCSPSADEKARAEEEALRIAVERAAAQPARYVPTDGPAKRPLVPAGLGAGTEWQPTTLDATETPAAPPAPASKPE